MKTLIIFYSLEGNTRFVSETLATELDGDLAEIKTKDELVNKNSLMKYIWWGKMIFQKQEPEILPIDKKIEDYDLIIIGTPVWAWTYTPPIASFFQENRIHGKKVAVFCCHGGWPRKTLEKMKEKLTGNTIVWQNNFREPLKYNKEDTLQKIICWAKELKNT